MADTSCTGEEYDCSVDCNEPEVLSLPNSLLSMSVNKNETPDPATLNRGISRLIQNQDALLEYITNIVNTSFSDGIAGCIKAADSSCVRLDMEYISTNLCLDGLLPTVTFDLVDMGDTCISDLVDGDSIVWNEIDQCFTNKQLETIGTLVSASSKVSEVTGILNPAEVTFGDISTSLVPVTNSYSFSIDDLILSDPELVVDSASITSIDIIARNFGRYDVEAATAQSWNTEVLLPSGWTEVQSYMAFNEDDDGGITTLVKVPYSHDFNAGVVHFRQNLANSNTTGLYGEDANGFPVNSITVKSINYTTVDSNAAFIKSENIKGYILEGSMSNGSLNTTTAKEPTLDNYYSEVGVVNDWSSVFDLVVPQTTYMTEISLIHSSIEVNAGTSGEDPGTIEGDSNTLGNGNIVIDWAKGTVKGYVSYATSKLLGDTKTVYFDGSAGTNIIATNDNLGVVDLISSIETGNKIIKSLPIICDTGGTILARNVSYSIRHYHIADPNLIKAALELDTYVFTSDYTYAIPAYSIVELVQGASPTNEVKTVTLPDTTNLGNGTRVSIIKKFHGDVIVLPNAGGNIISQSALYNSTKSESWGAKLSLILSSTGWIIDNAVGTWHSDASQL